MEAEKAVILVGFVLFALGSLSAFAGLAWDRKVKGPSAQFEWARQAWRGEVSRRERQLFVGWLVLGGGGAALIAATFLVSWFS